MPRIGRRPGTAAAATGLLAPTRPGTGATLWTMGSRRARTERPDWLALHHGPGRLESRTIFQDSQRRLCQRALARSLASEGCAGAVGTAPARSPNPSGLCAQPSLNPQPGRIRPVHPNQTIMTNNLKEAARQLRLSGLAASLEVRLQEAASHQLSHAQCLELLLQDELNVRAQRLLERRKKVAGFRDPKTLEDFDWSFNASIKRSQIFDLATGQFIRQHRDVLLLGPPGVGKSFLAQALGHAAIRAGFVVLYCSIFDLVRELQADQSPAEAQRTLSRYLKPDLLCIDDFGMKHFPPKSAEALLELIVRRHQNRSTLDRTSTRLNSSH